MFIGDLDGDAIITIEAYNETGTIRLDSQIVDLSDTDRKYAKAAAAQVHFESFVAIELIKEGIQTINFLSNTVHCKATATKNERPYIWEDIKIFKLNLPEAGSVHICFCNQDVDTFNRRNEYRVLLGTDAHLKIADSGAVHDILLKDISEHGIGFVMTNQWKIELGNNVNVQFYNQVYSDMRKDYEHILYKVNARVVRIVPANNQRLLIGCRMDDAGDALRKFIYAKQRDKLKIDRAEPVTKKLSDKAYQRNYEFMKQVAQE